MAFFLLQRAGFPQYVHEPTRRAVLGLFRKLLRQIGQLPDPLAREYLRRHAADKFLTYKFVTDPRRIGALCEHAEADLALCASANRGSVKDLKTVLDRAFRTVGVKQSPLRALVAVPPLEKTMAYKYNNLQMPATASFEAHNQARPETHPFYQFVAFLARYKLTVGVNGRKVFLQPPLSYTVLGKPVALCRQRNILRQTYFRILRDALRPVHPDVIAYLEQRLQAPKLDRRYRRRLVECAREYYSVNSDGELIRARLR